MDFYGVANAPIYGLDLNNALENFVDMYISCDNNKLTPNLCEAERHRHEKTCRKKYQAICQFNFPWPPMEKIQILEPSPMESLTPSKRVHLGEINKRIFEELNKIDLQATYMSFSALLKLFSIDKETYINALRVNFKNQQFSYKDYVKTYEQIPLVFMLEIFGKQTQMLNSYLTLMLQLVIAHLI